MKKLPYIILFVVLVGISAASYLARDKEVPVATKGDNQTATTTVVAKPKPKPAVAFGTPLCLVVSGKRYANLPITISEKGWSYAETSVKPVDTAITSNSGKTFENEYMKYPFYEFVTEDWGDTVVTVKLWQDKTQSPIVTVSRTISAEQACR